MEAVKPKQKTKKKQRDKKVTPEVTTLKNDEKDIDSCEEAAKEEIATQNNTSEVTTTNESQTQIGEFDKLLNSSKLLACELKQQKYPKTVVLQKQAIKPYTEEQLATLYTNSELQMIGEFTSQFVEAELKGLATKHHPLYELLATYLQVRAKIIGNSLELDQLRKEYRELQAMLWTTDTATVTGRGECLDGNSVTTTHSYQKATFHRSVFQSIARVLGLIRKLTYDNYTLFSYTAEDLRLQIELYVQTAINNCMNATGVSKDSPIILSLQDEPLHLKPFLCEIRLCISVLFAFQRKLIRDVQFLKESREWLSRLIAVLLRLATYQDHLFIVSHILRCPAGVGSWASSFIQTPLYETFSEPPFSSYQINHVLAVLTMILSPIKERERFLADVVQDHDTPGESLWIVVDSEGEEDDESGCSLRENDLVAFLTQLPLERLFRNVLLVERRNLENFYDCSKVSQHHILRFFAFATVFLKIVDNGLRTYDQSRYKQFAKRLSRLIRHIVQYATDQWEVFQKNPTSSDTAMMERLQVEYDAFFLRAIHYLYTSQRSGAWQFLAVIPYNMITIETVWKIFYFLHESDQGILAVDNAEKLWDRNFRIQFEEKLSALADDELYYLLNTFANMALARESDEMDFIEAATKDLLQVGFISEMTQDICSKSARTLLTHITSKHHHLLSMILKYIKENIELAGSLVLYLYEELPLTIWKLTDDDLSIIAWLLCHNSIQSNESKLARMILSRLNWDIIPYKLHCEVALLVLRASEQEPGYLQWGWQTILRLKLHINDKAFDDIKQVKDPEFYDVMIKGVHQQQPLASFVSVLMTSWGHLIPLICGNGLSQLLFLQTHQKHEVVLFALYVIVPLFIDSQEYIINNERFQEIISKLINADRGYISMAKSLISVQKTILQQFGNMIETQIVNFANYGLSSPRSLVRLWVNTFVSIPNWSRDCGVMYLLDVIIRAAFFHQDALEVTNNILKELLQNNVTQEQGTISSLFKWVSSSGSNFTLISGSLSSYTWLAFLVIELEFEDREKRTGLWRELLLQLDGQKGKVNVDAAIKKAASILKVAPFSSGSLSIYRWAQQAMDSPIDHPLLPLLWQKFFILYLARIPVSRANSNGCVGEKFFDGLVNFAFLKRMKRKLQETLDYYVEKMNGEEDSSRRLFLEACVNLFKAFSAWLEEPRLQKDNLLLPSLPALYQPNLLAFIIQGSNTPWYEYVDYEKIKLEQVESVQIWQSSNFRHKANINKPLLNPGKSMESVDPVERILRRLTSYETCKSPPDINNNLLHIPTIDFSDKTSLLNSLDQCFKTLKQFAHNHTLKMSEHKALDCSYQELVPQLYRSVLNKVSKKIPCKGRNETVNCSGAALIVLEVQEARVNERIDHQIQTNRNAYESLLTKSLQAPATALCTASVTLQQAIKILQLQVGNPSRGELGTELFYHILSLINDETSGYLPTKTLFASCLERLGQSHISGVEFEMPRLLEKILKEPALGGYLAPHFSPSNVGTVNLLYMYSRICQEIGNNYDVAFALLSKFEIDKWLHVKEPKLNQRSEFIQCVVRALSSLGFEPSVESLILHGLYRRHLLTIFEFQFPEHYGDVLINLLKSSNGSSENSLLSTSVWLDIVNCLAHPVQINYKAPLKDQLRQYTQHQKMLQHQELLETAELFAKHFTQERLQYGLYGLYPKCRNYIDIFVILLGMTGHGLITSTLNTHQGLLGDKMLQKIWPYLINMFAPWIVPYSMQTLKENMASWIQQLADDRSILLPWIPSDGPLAQKLVNIFCECVHFLIYTLPASSGNILSFIWQWYVTSFAHNAVKVHILGPVHHSFLTFPWESFWPSVTDLEFMLRVIDQYLPESHSFLGHIFMAVSWSPWLSNFRGSPQQIRERICHCYLHLLVKLSNEPNVRNKYSDRIKSLLVESENFGLETVDSSVYQHVMDWYVLSCDPSVIFRSDPLDVDFRVLHFLQCVSGYDRVLEESDAQIRTKRFIYVKSFVKLLSVYVNRCKSVVATKESDLNTVITQQLFHLEKNVKIQEEFNAILRELLGIVNLSDIRHCVLKCFDSWLLYKTGDEMAVRGILQVSGITVEDPEALGFLLESTLTCYFQSSVSGSFNPSWCEVAEILSVVKNKEKELEKVMLSRGYILALNALFLQKINKCNDFERLLNLATEWMRDLKFSGESAESKVPLLWIGIIRLTLQYCEIDENTTGVILHKFAKILIQISEDKAGSKWGRGLLSAIGISKQDAISINFRFLCRALAGYILAQLPEMKGAPQVVRRHAYAPCRVGQTGGNSECAKILMSLGFGQSQGKIKECEELALKKIQDAENSMHNAAKFVELLVKQFYIKPYLNDLS
ncbi:ectopic P granules protein 5 homolog isoform X2 [Tribolium madens]|uniref:ectopic P granules protein 5 homolog isoform X2 n=1 Tax=Tribolium madens TaxID=41895 RepID=UPI001CF74D58|nr:ectopic P granules protein 5 homolog isoform X2 [Tribolium madens]